MKFSEFISETLIDSNSVSALPLSLQSASLRKVEHTGNAIFKLQTVKLYVSKDIRDAYTRQGCSCSSNFALSENTKQFICSEQYLISGLRKRRIN